MRQLVVQVPPDDADRVLELAARHRALNSLILSARDNEDDWAYVVTHVANSEVGPLLNELEQLSHLHVTLVPQNVIPMKPPRSQVADQIRDVTPRSPLEVWLNGLQSVGSWKGLLAYVAAASVVVWIGMYTDTVYLLVAAMLIAPFAGPAMNSAIASAAGDRDLLLRNLARYFVSLGFMVAISALLSVVFSQSTATSTMISVSQLSLVAALLPLTAGAAGALNLVQAASSSLVAGTAVGLLIAASLAPPAALIGMSLALGRGDLAFNGAFTLLLQLFAINLGGAVIFRLYGLKPAGPRYEERGNSVIFYVSIVVSVLLLAGMVFVQVQDPPSLQRASRAQAALDVVGQVIDDSALVSLVEANVRFTRPAEGDAETLLGVLYVQRRESVVASEEEIIHVLAADLQTALQQQGFNATPLFDISILDVPPAAEATPAGES